MTGKKGGCKEKNGESKVGLSDSVKNLEDFTDFVIIYLKTMQNMRGKEDNSLSGGLFIFLSIFHHPILFCEVRASRRQARFVPLN